MSSIKNIFAREILDSRGNPTVEVDVILSDQCFGRAAVPSGASTGTLEAFELRDSDESHFLGKGVLRAVENVNSEIFHRLKGFDAFNQEVLDMKMIELDGTKNKSRLGANAILGVSMAVARAAASSMGIPLYRYISGHLLKTDDVQLPTPMFNILNGGAHADSGLDFQEFMIAPVGAKTVKDAIRMGSEVYQRLRFTLKQKGYSVSVGDEGGFAPKLKSHDEAIELILTAIEASGYKPGMDIGIALDPAASEFYKNDLYVLTKSNQRLTSDEMISFWADWIKRYPILSLEDGLAETDWPGWKTMTDKLGASVQLVGDDIFVTNPKIIQKAIDSGVANASLIKLNQIGTLTETLEAIAISKKAGYGTVISHRSGETSDDFISDLAVAVSAGQMKTGAPARGERVAKYNQLIRIEQELGDKATFAGAAPFSKKPGRAL